MLATCFPDVEVTEFDPEQQGKPGSDFGWSEYDVALMDYQLGIGENGLDWLETYRNCSEFSPTVLMSDEGDEYIAARSIDPDERMPIAYALVAVIDRLQRRCAALPEPASLTPSA